MRHFYSDVILRDIIVMCECSVNAPNDVKT